MRHAVNSNMAVKALLAGAAALAIAVGMLMPLPGRPKSTPTHSQFPTLEVGRG